VGDIRELGKILPSLGTLMINYMSSLVGLYHNSGPTWKACRWTFHWRIRCANNIECAFRDVPSYYLRRPTFLESAWVTVVIGKGYKSLSLSLSPAMVGSYCMGLLVSLGLVVAHFLHD